MPETLKILKGAYEVTVVKKYDQNLSLLLIDHLYEVFHILSRLKKHKTYKLESPET